MFNLSNKEGYCLLWDESLAKRGSNEIGSSLMKYIKIHQYLENVFLISDACGGQIRNQYVTLLCLYLTQTLPNIKTIDHMFMVHGHSHMAVDSMHARIKNKSDKLNI